METKNSIRKQILSLRNAMSDRERMEKSEAISMRVLKMNIVQKADVILCYAGYKSEVLTGTLIKELLDAGKKIYLPRVTADEMEFYRIDDLQDMVDGFMSIPEPGEHCRERFDVNEHNRDIEKVVMIQPGCVFSYAGARIGYGKGYYDRYLSKHPIQDRIALCYELQLVEQIPADEYDIAVTHIVTEQRKFCI